MANALYAKGREGFLTGQISWTSDTISAILVDTGQYTVNLASHDNLDDIPVAARVGSPVNLSGKAATDGIANASALSFPTVVGNTVEAVVIYKNTGVESTSRLIAYIDSATGLPVTPNGGAINITWDTGINKIFKL